MKLIVGLGNPGKQYEKTRHNAGFLALDQLISRHAPSVLARARFNAAVVEAKLPSPSGSAEPCLFMKPTTFMNRSGQAVAEAVSFYKLSPQADLLVMVDELAFPRGLIRLRSGGSAGGHNGLADIQRALGTDAYPRLRIGIGPKPEYMDDQADYVLGKFTDDEWAVVAPALGKSADAAELFVAKGIDAAMNRFNAPDTPPKPKNPKPTNPNPQPTPGHLSSPSPRSITPSAHEPPGPMPGPSSGKAQGL
jgi:peptidyl-tRNA hydrolase, PTH1 family